MDRGKLTRFLLILGGLSAFSVFVGMSFLSDGGVTVLPDLLPVILLLFVLNFVAAFWWGRRLRQRVVARQQGEAVAPNRPAWAIPVLALVPAVGLIASKASAMTGDIGSGLVTLFAAYVLTFLTGLLFGGNLDLLRPTEQQS